MSQDALDLWQEKLAFLQKELVLATGSEKFRLQKEIEEAEQMIAELQAQALPPTPVTRPPAPTPRSTRPPVRRHLFLSYVEENIADVEALHDDLIGLGETVWWDQDIPAGARRRPEIRTALKDAYAFVLCLSTAMAEGTRAGAFPEILDAIGIYRELAPGGIFIIPVRLDECQVPTFEIDSTTMLDDLRFVDLFPASRRPDGLSRLVAALKQCPGHP